MSGSICNACQVLYPTGQKCPKHREAQGGAKSMKSCITCGQRSGTTQCGTCQFKHEIELSKAYREASEHMLGDVEFDMSALPETTDRDPYKYTKLWAKEMGAHMAKAMPEDAVLKEPEPTTGIKHDSSKPQLSLVPIEGLEAAARALEYGAKKYSRGNYKGGLAHTRLLDAALRHLNQYASGETNDSESGLCHVDHALATLNMLAFMIKNRPDLDDRG